LYYRLRDPHVNDSPVNQCIRRARAIELRTAEQELAALSVKGSSWATWRSPLYGVALFQGLESTGAILKRVAVLPIAMFLLLILALMAPFDYVAHLRKLARTKAELKDEIRRLMTNPLPTEESPARTLGALWKRYGRKHDVDLLCEWVDILYGSGRSGELRIRERLLELGRLEIMEVNHEGKPVAPHLHYDEPMVFLLDTLSMELPPFLAPEPVLSLGHKTRRP
jgi:hypothetical protein